MSLACDCRGFSDRPPRGSSPSQRGGARRRWRHPRVVTCFKTRERPVASAGRSSDHGTSLVRAPLPHWPPCVARPPRGPSPRMPTPGRACPSVLGSRRVWIRRCVTRVAFGDAPTDVATYMAIYVSPCAGASMAALLTSDVARHAASDGRGDGTTEVGGAAVPPQTRCQASSAAASADIGEGHPPTA